MTVTFAADFRGQPNQAYIALSGDPKIMADNLIKLAQEIKTHGKPLQGTNLHLGTMTQVATPFWDGKHY